MEEVGIRVDQDQLRAFGVKLKEETERMYEELIEEVPSKVKRRHADKKNGLSFGRREFVQDILFSKEGFGLDPIVFTKSTRRLSDDRKVPSVSTKDHLPYFDDVPWVTTFIEWSKYHNMRNKYVGMKPTCSPRRTGGAASKKST